MINKTLSRFATHDNSAYPQLWRGCVGAWCPSLGPSGSRLHDFSRRMNWGTLANMDPATDWVVSEGRYALNFDGANNTATLDYQNSAGLTVCCWVFARNINDANGQYYVAKWGANPIAAENDFYFGSFANNWIARTGNGSSSQSSLAQSSATASRWTHLAITRDTASLKLYVDGVEKSSVSSVGLQGGGTALARLCFITSLPYADCLLDDVLIYNKPISPSDIFLLSRRRGIAFTPRARRLAVPEQAGAGVAKPVLFHSYYMSQGMRP